MVKNVKDGGKLKLKFGPEIISPIVLKERKRKKGGQDIPNIVAVEKEKDNPSIVNIAQKKKEREEAQKKLAKARCAKKIPVTSQEDDVKGTEEPTYHIN